jgi:UDP-N-acetylmuramate: L-alanyl-gamma-D-glutamyl-meso-diaminopimelate ligase
MAAITLFFAKELRFHFLGICGTAMGAVASMLKDMGYVVGGSDENVYPPLSTFLSQKGIVVAEGYKAENLPKEVDRTLVVVGNAIKRGNPELEAVLEKKYLFVSLPEILRFFFLHGKQNIIVTGTHGKTTTTSLLVWLFESACLNPSFFIGGLPKNFASGCRYTQSDYWILEGDEYDTAYFDKRSKFLHYLPQTVIINNIEYDHADIFSSLEDILLSFKRLVHLIPKTGHLIIPEEDPTIAEVAKGSLAPVYTVGLGKKADFQISEIAYEEAGSNFKMLGESFFLPMPGEYNVRNAAMAIAAATLYGIRPEVIAKALRGFLGVKRRLEILGEVCGIKILDDFGHHPTAIYKTIQAIRQRYPGKRIWSVFEPRSNTTRRAVFQKELPHSLSFADGVIVSEVANKEGIPPTERLNPEKIVQDINRKGIPSYFCSSPEDILERLQKVLVPGDVVVFFSNGSFYGLPSRLVETLKKSSGSI